jgi:hypothetical protein
MKFQSHSQAGQDEFVRRVLGEKPGQFLDIGAGHPIELSNTYALETYLGWSGILIEQDPTAANMHRAQRKSPVMQINALTQDWRTLPIKDFDYVSLDVDYISHKVLLDLLCAGITARVWTIEHNLWNYPNGGSPDWVDLALMQAKGYELIAQNVTSEGQPFENWYVDPKRVDHASAFQFSGSGRDGRSIVGL